MQDPWLEQWEDRRKAREAQDRSFQVLGETLTVKASVAPEVGLRLAAFQARLAAYTIQVREITEKNDALARAKKPLEPIPPMGVEDTEFLDLSEATIRSCLTPEAIPAWERLRTPDAAAPLTLLDIYALAQYVLSKASGLPTVAPVDSSNGRTPSGTSSTVVSPSRARRRKASA